MKTGYAASPTAQKKARRTIGPQGLVRHGTKQDGGSDSDVYQVGEWRGIGDFRIYGEGAKSFRQAFEAAGIYDRNPPRGTRT